MQKTFKQLKLTFSSISLLVLLCVSLILFAAQYAFAQTSDQNVRSAITPQRQATTTRAEIANVQQTLREQRQEEIAARRAENKARLEAAAQERVTKIGTTVITRIEVMIDKLSVFADRISTRAQQLEDRGVNVATVKGAVANAQASITEAERLLADMTVAIEYVATSDTPREDWATVREEFGKIKELLKSAHASLREAVTTLQALIQNEN